MKQVMQCKSCKTVLVFPADAEKPKRCSHCGSTFLREGTEGHAPDSIRRAVEDYEQRRVNAMNTAALAEGAAAAGKTATHRRRMKSLTETLDEQKP